MLTLLKILDPVPGLRSIFRSRFLLGKMVRRTLALKYKGAVLGVLWNFIQPLMMLAIYTFVFSVVFEARWGTDTSTEGHGRFSVILFAGMLVYMIFSESLSQACFQITNNTNYVKKVVFPLEILPLIPVLASFVQGLIWLVLLFFAVVFLFGTVSATMLLFPAVLLPLFLFTLGFAYFTASLSVYLRDTPYVVSVLLQMLFFMTPIFYPVSAVPEDLRGILEVNPLTVMINELRSLFLFGQMPDWWFLGKASLISLIVFLLGFAWFNKTKKGFADVL